MSNVLLYYKERTENFYTFEMVPESIKLNNINNSASNTKGNNSKANNTSNSANNKTYNNSIQRG